MNLVVNKSTQPIRAQVNISPALSNSSDRKLRVTWNRDANLLEIYFDGTKRYSWNNDIVKNVFKGNPFVWFGFTGSTGNVTSSKTGSTNYTATQSIKTDTLIYNQPIITASKDTICTGDTAILTTSRGVSYLWSNGATTKSIKVFKSGTYTVSVIDSSNCASSASQAIVVMPKITASFSVSNGCLGKNVPIVNNTTPTTGTRFNWNFGNGDSVSGSAPVYTYKSTGKFKINLSATNGGCSGSTSNQINVYARPIGIGISKGLPFQGQFNVGDVATPDYVCLGDSNTYQITSPSGYSNSDYGSKWIIASKTFVTAAGTINTDTISKNPTASKNAWFEFFPGSKFADSVLILTVHIQLIPGNCDTVITRYIQARSKAISKFIFANACQGFALPFHDTSSIVKGDAITTWNWTFGDGASSPLQNPVHTYSKSGTYSVTLFASSNAGCGIPVTQKVIQYPEPVVRFNATSGCQQTSTLFTDSSTVSSGSIVSDTWNFGNGTGPMLKSPGYLYYAYPKSGPYSVKLVVTSSFGCKDSITKAIRIEPVPTAAFSYNNACVGTPIYFANKSTDSTTGTKYQWSFGDNGTSTSAQPSHTYAANGTYRAKLTATTKYGCIDTIVQKITPYAETVPNITYSGACAKTAVAFGDSD